MPSPSGYDAELRRHNQVLHRAVGVQFHDHVLDVGCGAGQTTREAARTAQAGSAFGVDVSAPAIGRARELARADGLRNVTFECADAQVYRFPPERFDLAVSRFGTMFFDDPVAAFANIRRALRPAGRLAMMVWQAPERNEWEVAIRQSLGTAEGRWPVFPTDRIRSRSPTRRPSRGSCRRQGSLESPSPTSANRSATVRTWLPLSTGSAASGPPAKP
jgi:SAM-dependent methyltransferase